MPSNRPALFRPGPLPFGKYSLVAKLATGGMGEVLLGHSRGDGGFSKLVVIKRVLPHLLSNQDFIDMFLNEARIAAGLNHPNICQIYELGKIENQQYMALEYLEGLQLATLFRARKRSPLLSDPRLTLTLLSQACEGLHFAHNLRMPDGSLAEVVHRDVNPKNIFVTSAGSVKVLDFGVAKARGKLQNSKTGVLKGTYSYMSPEQLSGGKLDRRSDVFSLGIIAWEAVTGRRLFKRPTDVQVWRAIVEKPIPNASALAADVPAKLDKTIAKALARNREERFSTARELALALEESLSDLGPPLSTVAIAAELERVFSTELEAQRSLALQAQRVALADDDADDDDFDVPTTLFTEMDLGIKPKEALKIAAGSTGDSLVPVVVPKAVAPTSSPSVAPPEDVSTPEHVSISNELRIAQTRQPQPQPPPVGKTRPPSDLELDPPTLIDPPREMIERVRQSAKQAAVAPPAPAIAPPPVEPVRPPAAPVPAPRDPTPLPPPPDTGLSGSQPIDPMDLSAIYGAPPPSPVEEAAETTRRKRDNDQTNPWLVRLVMVAFVAGVAYASYYYFSQTQSDPEPPVRVEP